MAATCSPLLPVQWSGDLCDIAVGSRCGTTELVRSLRISKSHYTPWNGLIRMTTGRGDNQHHSAADEGQKTKESLSRFCLELLSSSGFDNASSYSSSMRNWNSRQGYGRRERTDTSSQVVTVAGFGKTGLKMARRPRERKFTEGIGEGRQFSDEVALATHRGQHCAVTENRDSTYGHLLTETLEGTSGGRRHSGLKPAPTAFKLITDVQPKRSLRDISCCCSADEQNETKLTDAVSEDGTVNNVGVQMALALLRFYKSLLLNLVHVAADGLLEIFPPYGSYHPIYQRVVDMCQLVVSIRNKRTRSMDLLKVPSLQPGAWLVAILWAPRDSTLQGGLERISPLKYDILIHPHS